MGGNYKSSGVDIDKADIIKEKIKEIARHTYKSFVLEGVGPFSAVLKLKGNILLATSDGVGTKTLLAVKYGRIKTLGYDLVAMNVNDILAMHGKPLFFLDYIGVSSLDEKVDIIQILEGIAEACREADCSLVGGETAQMPGFYSEGAIELVGFCVGTAKKNALPKINKVKPGDIILAFPSQGIHSNGFSLIRKLISDGKIDPQKQIRGKSIIELLLTPTKIYVSEFFQLVKLYSFPKVSAHITGGGIPGNLGRVIPPSLTALIDKEKILQIQEKFSFGIFSYISDFVSEDEMFKVFNMGVGFLMVYPRKVGEKILSDRKVQVFEVGFIKEAKDGRRVTIV